MTTRTTQEIAKILKGATYAEGHNQEWFGAVIGRHQTTAGQILNGKKAMSTEELWLACEALGLGVVNVVREAESRAGIVTNDARTGGDDQPKKDVG